MMAVHKAPVNDAILVAIARLVDDALLIEKREPSHYDIEFLIKRAGLSHADPKAQGQAVGKAKRVRAVLSWAIDNDPNKAQTFAYSLLQTIRGKGGFRPASKNFVGEDAIADTREAFRLEGYNLTTEGELLPNSLDNLSGIEMTEALEVYVRRAQRGSEDGALVIGTGKDLLEATAAHVIAEKYGSYRTQDNFPTLLGQAFTALGLATPLDAQKPGESPYRRVERSLYESGCAVNALRNKSGTGHGRPFLTSTTNDEARAAVQLIGIVSGLLLRALKRDLT